MMRQLLRPVLRTTRSGTRSAHHAPSEYRYPHMDDLPVPTGCWKEAYTKRQTQNNIILAAGVLSVVGTIIFGKAIGVFYLNWAPPSRDA